jgi:hypothetical protein
MAPKKPMNPTTFDDAAPAEYPDPRTALAPDEIGQTVQMTPAEIQAAEQERAALLAALEPPAPYRGPEAKDGRLQRPTPADVAEMFVSEPVTEQTVGDPVADALAEQARLLTEVEDAKARLEAANVKVARAKEQVAGRAYQQARVVAAQQLKPLAARVVAQRNALQQIHEQYKGDLKDYARTCASGDLIRRTKLQSLYSSAQPLANKIGTAFKLCEDAIRLLDRANKSGAESLPFAVSIAISAGETALAHDADKLREECAALVSAVNAWRAPGSTLRVRIVEPDGAPWRPGMGGPASGVEV